DGEHRRARVASVSPSRSAFGSADSRGFRSRSRGRRGPRGMHRRPVPPSRRPDEVASEIVSKSFRLERDPGLPPAQHADVVRRARPHTAACQGACPPRKKSADGVRSEAAFRSYGGTIARPTTAEPPGQPPTVRDSETCGEPPPLRFPPRDERCSEIVGRSKKP